MVQVGWAAVLLHVRNGGRDPRERGKPLAERDGNDLRPRLLRVTAAAFVRSRYDNNNNKNSNIYQYGTEQQRLSRARATLQRTIEHCHCGHRRCRGTLPDGGRWSVSRVCSVPGRREERRFSRRQRVVVAVAFTLRAFFPCGDTRGVVAGERNRGEGGVVWYYRTRAHLARFNRWTSFEALLPSSYLRSNESAVFNTAPEGSYLQAFSV